MTGDVFEDQFMKLIFKDGNFARIVVPEAERIRLNDPINQLIFYTFCKVFKGINEIPTLDIVVYEIAQELRTRNVELHSSELEKISQKLHLCFNVNGLGTADIAYLKSEYKNLFFLKDARQTLVNIIQRIDREGVLDEGALQKIMKGNVPKAEPIDWLSSIEDRTSVSFTDETKVPTLIPPLDVALQGGLGSGELGIIMAGPKVGKSMMLINLGFAAAVVGVRVLHITLELSAKQTLKRYDSIFTGIPINSLKASKQQIIEKLQEFKKFQDLILVQQFPTKGCTPADIESSVQYVTQQKGKVGLVIVDYGDLVKAPQRRDQVRFELEDIFLSLRNIAGTQKVAVWTATQTNRIAVGKTDVDERHLAEAFSKAMICDLLASLTKFGDLLKFQVILSRATGASSLFIPLRPHFETARLRYEKIEA